MTNLLEQFEQQQIVKLSAGKNIPHFRPGDTLSVTIRILEGASERTQIFEGLCIARRNRGVNSSFAVRKVSFGEGVEKLFPLYSPLVKEIKIIQHGKVRRAKLYYIRKLSDKASRIKPDMRRRLQAVAEAKALKAADKKLAP